MVLVSVFGYTVIMKKYITTLIMVVVFVTASIPAISHAAELTSAQIGVIAQVLLQNDDFTSEQVIQIVAILMAQSSQNTVMVDSGILSLKTGELCAAGYKGDPSTIAIQQELQNQGYAITKVDGKIGAETRAAVTAFQGDNGAAKIDGKIGAETRSLLIRESVACIGDPGTTVQYTQSPVVMNNLCRFTYNGDPSTIAIQQELQNQGYAITKVDGKIGNETRAAVTAFQNDNNVAVANGLITQDLRILLARNSLVCDALLSTETDDSSSNISEITVVPPVNPIIENTVVVPVVTDEVSSVNPDDVDVEIGENVVIDNLVPDDTDFVVKDELLAAVRSSGQTPDDTAVFTYRMTLNPDSPIYISNNPTSSFDINIYNELGMLVSVEKINSIVSSSQRILRDDGTSFFRVQKGDTLSLRTTAQPGVGSYYAELSRLTYTSEDAEIIPSPALTNYDIDTNFWRSGTVQIKN